jgi:hypothetical protein
MEILGATLGNIRSLDTAHYETSISRLTGYSKGGQPQCPVPLLLPEPTSEFE